MKRKTNNEVFKTGSCFSHISEGLELTKLFEKTAIFSVASSADYLLSVLLSVTSFNIFANFLGDYSHNLYITDS